MGKARSKELFWQRSRFTLFCGVALLMALGPFIWTVITSFKTIGESYAVPPTLIPQDFTWDNYPFVLFMRPLGRYILNSTIVTIPSTILTIVLASFAAYGFARLKFPGRIPLFFLVLVAEMFPGPTLITPIFTILHALGLYNTLTALFILYTTFSLPLSTWILYAYFKKLPKEIEDAALIDGCSRTSVFLRIIVPISKPGLGAVAVFAFLVSWNEYLFALLLIDDPGKYTVALGVARYFTEFTTYWNYIGASSVIITMPAILVFFLFGKNLITGLTAGAVKG